MKVLLLRVAVVGYPFENIPLCLYTSEGGFSLKISHCVDTKPKKTRN